jgi:stearoyl-CoA desaturase (delta-9 desaturase)
MTEGMSVSTKAPVGVEADQGPKEYSYLFGYLRTKTQIIWFPLVFRNVLGHLAALYALKSLTFGVTAFVVVFAYISLLSSVAGYHRLWSHNSYKAKTPLRIILMLVTTTTAQDDIFTWVRDHKMHHKYTDTDADPYTISRGFFFAHIGWLMMKKHPSLLEKGHTVDMTDTLADPVVRFNRKYFYPLSYLTIFILPMWFLCSVMNLSVLDAFCVSLLRLIITSHITFTINSFAHSDGPKPYDKNIRATDNILVRIFNPGDGFHNFHHVFPFDYKSSEFAFTFCNTTTMFIDLMAKFGLAYDRKVATPEMIKQRMAKSGDGFKYGKWGSAIYSAE